MTFKDGTTKEVIIVGPSLAPEGPLIKPVFCDGSTGMSAMDH